MIHHQNYQSAYKGKPAPSDTPMTARKRLEEKRPNTFIGRSFGVGDVIVWDEEKERKFFYVDKEELIEFGGFMDADAAGNTVVYMVPNYQIDGKTGTWLPYDSEVVEGVCFFMMRNEQLKDTVSPIVVDSKGVFVTDAPNGFENVRSMLTEYVHRAEKKQQDMTEYAMYAKDISKKIWTSLQRKKEAGYAVGNDAPYGYIRNPVTKRNEIDPEAAFYVQLIFQWELMGVPIFEIARRMTLLQVPTPREWHRKMVEGKEVLTCKKWGVTTIRHILENQTYVGDTINNKSTQKLFAGQDKRDLPKEQWYVAKNTHPAIIARDDFEKVQKILDKNRAVFHTVRAKSEQIRTEYQNDLAGMVFCADCGRPMEFERLPHGAEESKKVCYYICKARQADDKCIGHQIPEKLLKALIMDQLHLFIVQLSDKRKVLEELQKIEDVQNPVYRAKGEIMSLTDKVSQMAKKREQLYADYVAGVVDSEDYQLIREDYSRQYDGLRATLQEAETKKVQVEQQIEEYLNMTSHLEEHLDNFEFDIQLVKSLVQKIEVSADKRIRIVFGFRDVFTELGKESAES